MCETSYSLTEEVHVEKQVIWFGISVKNGYYFSVHFTRVRVPDICYSVGKCWQVTTTELEDSIAISV